MAVECPECGSKESQIKETRSSLGMARRRRVCLMCDHAFTTFEMNDKQLKELRHKAMIADQVIGYARDLLSRSTIDLKELENFE